MLIKCFFLNICHSMSVQNKKNFLNTNAFLMKIKYKLCIKCVDYFSSFCHILKLIHLNKLIKYKYIFLYEYVYSVIKLN